MLAVFDIHLPILYGKSGENALGRLLAEIISRSGDISVLDWVGEASWFHSCFPAQLTPYRALPLPLPVQSNPEDYTSIMSEQPAALAALRTLYRTLAKSPPPRFVTHRLALPCIAHRVTAIQLKEHSACTSNFSYEIQASGLKLLEVTLPRQLESAAMLPGALQLVRPWHSKLLEPYTKDYARTEEQLLRALGRPFRALLLIELPHNEFRRIASSIPIAAQPIDSASIVKSNVRVFDIV
ncbi:hypothetical protein EDD15DRAFT_2437511 [Pisolithus albus]|nr:hypothetical protein EDD15DRAFT_2437511 [Pisolithus albus]